MASWQANGQPSLHLYLHLQMPSLILSYHLQLDVMWCNSKPNNHFLISSCTYTCLILYTSYLGALFSNIKLHHIHSNICVSHSSFDEWRFRPSGMFHVSTVQRNKHFREFFCLHLQGSAVCLGGRTPPDMFQLFTSRYNVTSSRL